MQIGMTGQVAAFYGCMKVVAYLRVSTDRQAEEGLGLEVQRHTIRAWAKTHGHRVVAWMSDEGVSGSNGLDGRIGLAEALDAVRERRAQGLVIYRLDRLARDLVLQEQLLAEVRRLGGVVLSASDAETAFLVDDPDDPSRKLIRQVLGAVSEYERSMITLRLRSGRARKAATGGFAYGAPPFGCRSERGELLDDEREQATIARASELRSQGRSLRDIADTLTDEGHQPRRAVRWHPQVVSRLLSSAT
jgi:DNA invertase Pin-like site-specific DNA recombinase